MEEYDVIVLGAGPAGLAAAIHARQCQLSCIVVDRMPETHCKPCGDGISRPAVAALERLGIDRTELMRWGANDIVSSIHYFPNRTVVLRHPENSMFTLSRAKLLELLRERAKQLGAVLQYGCEASMERTASGQYRIGNAQSANIINAAGTQTNPWIDPQVRSNLPVGYSATIRVERTNLKEKELVFIHHRPNEQGYCWAFPLGENRWNIGVWQVRDRENLTQSFKTFEEGWLKDAFEGITYLTPPRGATLGVRFGKRKHSQDQGMLFCGDAAGCCNQRDGEGISSAIESSRMAVDLIRARMSGNPSQEDDWIQSILRCPWDVCAASPIYIGRSGDAKVHIETDEGALYCRAESNARKRKTIAALADLIHMPNIVLPEKVVIPSNGSKIYMWYPWIDGMNLEQYMDFHDLEDQRRMGTMAGKILKQLHSIRIEKYREYKYDYLCEYRQLKQYIQSNRAEFSHFSEICEFIDQNVKLLRDRPTSLTLQDVRPENIMVGEDGHIYFIDILGARLADPWSDLIKCTVLSPDFVVSFANAMLDEYFGGKERPENFHRILALYSGFALLKYAEEKFKARGKIVVLQAERVYAYIQSAVKDQ